MGSQDFSSSRNIYYARITMIDNTFSDLFHQKYEQEAPLRINENLTVPYWIRKKKEECKCYGCTKKNSFDDDIYIVITGGTKYIKEILPHYAGYKNVVWALDESTSMEDFRLIDSTDINPIVIKKFVNDLNLEACSAIAGLEYAKSLGAKKCLKVGSDMVFSPLNKFLHTINFERSGFLDYTEYPCNYRKMLLDPTSKEFMRRVSKHKSFITRNRVVDFCMCGPVNDLLVYFNYYEFPDKHVPYEAETGIAGRANGRRYSSIKEYKFMFNYMKAKGYEINNTEENLKKIFQFFWPTLEENDIDLIRFGRPDCYDF